MIKKKYMFTIIIIIILILLVAIVILMLSQNNANKQNVEISVGDSKIYSKEELNEAVEIVLNFFNFPATLNKIWYDEETSKLTSSELAIRYNADEAITLYCNFTTYSHIGKFFTSSPLNQNSEYTDYSWILIRNNRGSWILKSFGY